MSAEEIVRDYKAAKNPQKQIEILADLNGCSKADIINTLEDNGCRVPNVESKRGKGRGNSTGVLSALAMEERRLRDRAALIPAQIAKLQEELDMMDARLEAVQEAMRNIAAVYN